MGGTAASGEGVSVLPRQGDICSCSWQTLLPSSGRLSDELDRASKQNSGTDTRTFYSLVEACPPALSLHDSCHPGLLGPMRRIRAAVTGCLRPCAAGSRAGRWGGGGGCLLRLPSYMLIQL